MTLQQKMQSKKGFTLVELVVVIAILAILAAIAIPAVIGIINSANESQKASDAATVDNACKTYYAGIVAGSITSNDKTNMKNVGTSENLPAPGKSSSERKSCALDCTVGGAIDYNGTYASLNGKLADFGADREGNIYSKTDAAHSTQITVTNISKTTKLGSGGLGYK